MTITDGRWAGDLQLRAAPRRIAQTHRRPSEPATGGAAGNSGLIARDRELAHLEHVLWSARQGTASAVALRGEPGVGKSALIEAIIDRATPDFAVIQLRGTTLGAGSAQTHKWPGPLVELLSHFVTKPNAAAHHPNGSAAHTVDSAKILERMLRTATAPVLVAVDDCELFPEGFPAALAAAVTGALSDTPTALLLAYGEQPQHSRASLAALDIPEHHLGGLEIDQCARLVTAQIGEPAPRVLRALHEATGGNPFALLDACHNLTADQLNDWRVLPEPIAFSDAIVQPFGAVLAELPDDARSALGTAAAGRAPVNVLRIALDILGLSIQALAPAQRRNVVSVRGNRLDFGHPLVRAAAYQQLPADYRSAIHYALASGFAQCGHVERAAVHRTQTTVPPNNGLSRLWGQASRVALDDGNQEAAARHEEMAAQFTTKEMAAHHLARAADLWSNAGHYMRALSCLERAAKEPHTTAFVHGEVLYQRATARRRAGQPNVVDDMIAAATLCEEERPDRAASMLADAAAHKLLFGAYDDADAVAERALALAEVVSSHAEALARALHASVAVLRDKDRTGDIWKPVSLLVGQTHRLPATASVAYAIGISLLQGGNGELVMRWATWVEQCARSMGNRALGVVPILLRAAVAVESGRLDRAVAAAEAAAEQASRCHAHTLTARALAILVDAHAARGSYGAAFESAARLFSISVEIGPAPRVEAQLALALLELQWGRSGSAVAWVRAAEEVPGPEVGADQVTGYRTVRYARAPVIATLMLLARQADGGQDLIEDLAPADAVHPAWLPWVRGVFTPDIESAQRDLHTAALALERAPLMKGRLELCWGVRLLDANDAEGARPHLERALRLFRGLDAQGWIVLAEREYARLPASPPASLPMSPREATTMEPAAASPASGPATTRRSEGARYEWEVSLLGGFSVRRHGQAVPLPPSLAAQGLKIVALRRRVPVDELVELLWPEAGPGVGTRRLRNVLWRVRAACGDLLRREGPFVSLDAETQTDVTAFRRLAEQALDRDCPSATAAKRAREALDLYHGELLPGDRYADWAALTRDSLSRLHGHLLQLLLADAMANNHAPEALGVLDRLIDQDPYEEQHYMRAAELHARNGSRGAALSMLARAERMLADLGVPPSPALRQLRSSLTTD